MASDKKISDLKEKTILESLEKWFDTDSSWDSEWRDNAKKWYGYYHGEQWTSEEQQSLRERGQAVITFNHIKPAIDSIIGSERQNRPKVTMAGRTLDDQRIAEVKTKLYDYIQYNSKTDDELDRMIRDGFVAGRGWLYVFPDLDGEDFNDVRHSFVDYRDMFCDPLSKKDDLSDSRRVHRAVFTDEDIVKKAFPKYSECTEEQNFFESSSEDEMWYDKGDRRRPRLINSWYRDENGEITTVIWVKGQVLYFKKQPYTLQQFPFVQFTVERNLENEPYGLVKGMIDPQDEVNKRHSKALHYLNAKQVLAEENAFVDWAEAKNTLAKPDGITKLADGALSNGMVQIVDNTVLAGTHIQLLELAKSEILASAGINEAFVGQSGQYESAKKANMSIAQTQTTLVPILNKLRIARYDLADITMKMSRDFYNEERTFRIIEPNGAYSFMPVNAISLMADGTFERINDITTDDVDIIIEDAPRGLNEREEQFMQLLQIQGQTPRPIPMEVLLRYSSIKDKHQLANDLESHYNLEGQIQQAQQVIEQLQAQVKQLGGVIDQQQSQIVQTQTARQVEKEVGKAKDELGL